MECSECDSRRGHYEALTFAVARKESELEIAKRMREIETVTRLTEDLQRLAAQRQDARGDLARHRESAHQSKVGHRSAER
jgi:hypothetical protein